MRIPILSLPVNRGQSADISSHHGSIVPHKWQPLGNHGNWCGANNTRSDPNYPVWDKVDAVCREHDLCIKGHRGHDCSCDRNFMNQMAVAMVAPGVGARGRAYAASARYIFTGKPCFCDVRVLGRNIRVPGMGGVCGNPIPAIPIPHVPTIPLPHLPSIPRPRLPW
jgi:hypothetical protein